MPATISTNHLPDLLLNFLDMVKKGEHCNVSLQCQDGLIKVPGLILASVSPLIRQLGTLMAPEPDFNIILPDFTVSNISLKSTYFISNNFLVLFYRLKISWILSTVC